MKRFISLWILIVFLFSLSGCSKQNKHVDRLFEGLKVYDREIMSEVLTEFPDNSRFVYVDDIFNDEGYRKTYEKLFPSIEYKVVFINENYAKVEVTMPDLQGLYTEVSAWVLTQALNDTELQDRLEENEMNGVILIQEIMYSYAVNQPEQIRTITQEFQLTFAEDGRIKCTDSIRALITGNLFLSKNTYIDSNAE